MQRNKDKMAACLSETMKWEDYEKKTRQLVILYSVKISFKNKGMLSEELWFHTRSAATKQRESGPSFSTPWH